jgi:xylan 1,4-beta-xylosidase
MSIQSAIFVLMTVVCLFNACPAVSATWTADNGNGTFTNPLFYDEFSDPDIIRVGEDFYLTGTTNHAMPGLPILHSRDLVNWEFLCYAFERLDLGPEFRLEEGRDCYGQGIWAPSFRYYKGTYYIFTNINQHKTQIFSAQNPAGPWTRREMKCSLHDLSVLFDDDGRVFVVWGYDEIHFAQLNDQLNDLVAGSEQIIIQKGSGMGEGSHFYKIQGKYFITSAWYAGRMRMPCARSDKPQGPYEVNAAISIDENFGLAEGYRLRGKSVPPYDVISQNTIDGGRMSLHQGGIVDTQTGQWWGFSMMDFNSVGRLTGLSPVTWQDGWPYFGLPGNLKRTPRTWLKPDTGHSSKPHSPYERSDDFSGTTLKPIWQWNHLPDDTKWSLSEHPGFLRLHSLPSRDLLGARNTLTQRAIGPVSIPTVKLDTVGMQAGDTAGLALLNAPCAWIGVSRKADGLRIDQFDQLAGKTVSVPFKGTQVWLRIQCDFLTEKARFSYSLDGVKYEPLGAEFTMIFQLRTFQGIRYSLFHYNLEGIPGGYADFDSLTVDEPHPNGLMRPIPFGQSITLSTYGDDCVLSVADNAFKAAHEKTAAVKLKVVDQGLGRVALECSGGFISVAATDGKKVILKQGKPAEAETFQWVENVYGDVMLLSLVTHRHLRIDPISLGVTADHPGPLPDRKDGSCFIWKAAEIPPTVNSFKPDKTAD